MSIPISAIVLTKNEAANIRACLETIGWADEVLVVDSLSSDATVEIAQSSGARVVLHPFTNFAAQRNYAQQQARFDWLLFVDADERVTPELRDEIIALCKDDTLNAYHAYHFRRVHIFSGHWWGDPKPLRLNARLRNAIRRSEVSRLYNRQNAVWRRALHEEVIVPEPHGILAGSIKHYATSNLSLALTDFNYYTDLEAARLHAERTSARPPGLLEALARGFRFFVFMYLVWGLYKHGENGLLQALIGGFTKFINYAKLAERIRIQNNQGEWTDRDRALLTKYNVNVEPDAEK